MKKMFSILMLIFLTGCATKYETFEGNIDNLKVNDKLTKIFFTGNDYTSEETTQNYALLRSAEYANKNNSPYFIIYNSLFDAAVGKYGKRPNVGTIAQYSTAFCYVMLLNNHQPGAIKTEDILKQKEKITD